MGPCVAVLWLIQLAYALSAAEPPLVKLAVSKGEDIRFSRVSRKDGLSPGQVTDIVQDNQGFLWFNTSGFLDRYDGYTFKSYTRDAAHPNYPAGGFLKIFKDRYGYLWISSNQELDRFDPVTETSTRFPIDHNGPHSVLGPVLHISQDRAGLLWLSTLTGLHRLDPAAGTFRHYSHNPSDPASLSSSAVTSTYEDREGTLWVCTLAGLDAFNRRTDKVTERLPLNLAGVQSIKALEDHAGVLWIIYTSGNGLASWDRHTQRLTRYSFKDREPPATELSGVERIYEDADDNLWLTTYGSGLVKIDPTRRSAVQYRASQRSNAIEMDSLLALTEDREGTVWLGVAGTGVDKFRRKPLPFKRYVVQPGSLFEPFITIDTSVYVDSQENIWVGSPIGLTRIDGKSGKYSLFRQGPGPVNLSNSFVTSMVEDRSGDLWIGTYGGGLNRYDPRIRSFTVFRHNPADPESLSNNTVYSLLIDHHGVLWAGTEDGLNRCEDPATGRFRSWRAGPAGASPQEVGGIAEDSKGMLWLSSGTLQRFDPATGRFTAYTINLSGTGKADTKSSSTLVRSGTNRVNGYPTIDHSGMMWAATEDGLLRFDPQREQFTAYYQSDGLPSNSVNAVLEDHTGNLWVSTASGLSRFNPVAKTFVNYDEADGLTSDNFAGFPAAYKTARGEMFFGNTRGLTSFWPDQIVEKPLVPPVVLTGFSLLNRPVAPGQGSVLAKSIALTRSLTLSHKQDMFSFEFAALSYLDPPRNQYRYMLEGLDHSWIPTDSDHRVATFTTLPAGNYRLRIQGSNNRGVWNEQGVALQLQILPPWWGTWWFRAVCAVVFLTLLWAAYQYRVRQLQWAFNIRLEERVDERTRIARELHDTLLQSFQALVIVFQAARNLLPARADQAADILDDGLQQAAEAIAEGRDAIQNLRANPSIDRDLASLLTAAGQQLAHSPEAQGRAPAFRVVVEGSRQPLAPILQDEIYRIGREMMRNAFRHARADRVEAEIRYESGLFRLRVRDDGKGIDSRVLKEGVLRGHWGLPGMQERAKSMGGRLKIWSEPGAGTEAELTVPARIAYAKSPPGTADRPSAAGDSKAPQNGGA
jgi:signal transduction histidine kinase/ligand-binding sensor domain-containing protein